MDADTVALFSAVGQVTAASAAVAGLVFLGWQIKVAGKTTDLQTLQTFSKDAKEHEASLLSATNEAEKEQAFIEFLNFLEIYALALKDGLPLKTSRKLMKGKILDAIATIQSQPEWLQQVPDSVTSSETFEGLSHFYKKHKAEIDDLCQSKKQQ